MTVVLVFSSMGLHVRYQRIPVGKRFTTEFALVLSGFEIRLVTSYMSHQRMIIGKSFATRIAHVLIGSVFDVHVAVKLSICKKTFIAKVTVPREAFEVPPLMSCQLRSLDKSSTADITDEVALAGVNAPVDRQSIGAFEPFKADLALVRPSIAVRYKMAIVEILRLKMLVAKSTLVASSSVCITLISLKNIYYSFVCIIYYMTLN